MSEVKKTTKTAKTTKTSKTTKCAKSCTKKCEAKCAKHNAEKAAVEAKGISEIKDKIVKVVKKIPAWLVRVQAELKHLISRLAQLDTMIEKLKNLISSGTTSKSDRAKYKAELTLLNRQKAAMNTYRKILETRIENADK
jgi:hypothetical protein